MKSRKQLRKEARKQKKERRAFYCSRGRRRLEGEFQTESHEKDKTLQPKHSLVKKTKNKQKSVRFNKIESFDKTFQKRTSVAKKDLIEREEKEIKKYEKKLKLNKRHKKGTLPKSFHEDGLGYVLDAVDGTGRYEDEEENAGQWREVWKRKTSDGDDNEDQSDVSDVDMEDGREEVREGTSEQIDKEIEFSGDGGGSESDKISDEEDCGESGDDGEGESDLSDVKESVQPKRKQKKKVWQDIYGRLRDNKGNVIEKPQQSSLLGAATRETLKNKEVSEQLMRQMRGCLNRLTAHNISVVSSQIKDLFSNNSNHDVNQALWCCARVLLIDLSCLAPVKLVSEFSVLISILNVQVGEEVGGFAIHSLIRQFDEMLSKSDQPTELKQFDNVVMLIVNLYSCGLVEAGLVFDVIDKLCNVFDEKCIELVMFILKSVGFVLRKDSASRMKELIQKIQHIASATDKSTLSGNRIVYILDALVAIKNNNISKLNGYGTGVQLDVIENTLKSTLKKPKVACLFGKYEEVVQSARWWTQTISMQSSMKQDKSDAIETVDVNEKLCKKLRLNTPLRKALFVALSTCQDYLDAAQKMIRIGKKSFPEVITVTLHVALHEKSYNQFYAHLFEYLSRSDRKYKIALDFAIRDKVSELHLLKSDERRLLAEIIFQLVKLNVLAITCLKVVDFSRMDQVFVDFIKHILCSILALDDQLIQNILSRIPKKDSFATAMRLFMACFVDENMKHKLNRLNHLKI